MPTRTTEPGVGTSVNTYPKTTLPIAVLQDRFQVAQAEHDCSGTAVLGDHDAVVLAFDLVDHFVNKTILFSAEFEHYMLLTEGLLSNRDGHDYGTQVAGQTYGGRIPVDEVSLKPATDAKAWLRGQC